MTELPKLGVALDVMNTRSAYRSYCVLANAHRLLKRALMQIRKKF